MNDYKELVVKDDAAFRHIISEYGANGKVWFDKRFIFDYVAHLKYALEQLVKERDAAIKCIEGIETLLDYGYEYEIREEIKHWRGVQE